MIKKNVIYTETYETTLRDFGFLHRDLWLENTQIVYKLNDEKILNWKEYDPNYFECVRSEIKKNHIIYHFYYENIVIDYTLKLLKKDMYHAEVVYFFYSS